MTRHVFHGDPDLQSRQWMTQAKCRESRPDLWFADKAAGRPGRRALHGDTRTAVLICRECPVRAQCLAYALAHGEQYGIWGGLTADQRVRLKQRRSR